MLNLLKQCEQFNPDFSELKEEAINLNPYITKSRYPDDVFMMPSIMLAEQCIRDAERIVNFVKNELSEFDF